MMLAQEGRMVMVELYSTWDVAATDALVAAYEKMAAGMKVQQKQAAAAATQAAESKLETLVRQEKQAGQTLRKCRGTLERLIGEYDEAVGAHKGSEIIGVCLSVCPPELKVRTPAHTEHPGWYLEFESRVTRREVSAMICTSARSKNGCVRFEHLEVRCPPFSHYWRDCHSLPTLSLHPCWNTY